MCFEGIQRGGDDAEVNRDGFQVGAFQVIGVGEEVAEGDVGSGGCVGGCAPGVAYIGCDGGCPCACAVGELGEWYPYVDGCVVDISAEFCAVAGDDLELAGDGGLELLHVYDGFEAGGVGEQVIENQSTGQRQQQGCQHVLKEFVHDVSPVFLRLERAAGWSMSHHQRARAFPLLGGGWGGGGGWAAWGLWSGG